MSIEKQIGKVLAELDEIFYTADSDGERLDHHRIAKVLRKHFGDQESRTLEELDAREQAARKAWREVKEKRLDASHTLVTLCREEAQAEDAWHVSHAAWVDARDASQEGSAE